MNLYCISFPNKKKYFGIETVTGSRWASHRHQASRGGMLPVHRAIRKYGAENCKFIYIYQGISKEYAIKLEIAFIKNYDTTNYANGYNVSPGGDHWTPGPSTRAKIAAASKRQYERLSEEEKKAFAEKMSKLNKGKKQTPEQAVKSRESLAKANAAPRSDEYKAMLAERKRKWWADRKAQGLTGNIAYTKNPHLKPEPKAKIVRAKKWERLKPVSQEHREKVAQKKREWWAAKKAAGQNTWQAIVGRPKKSGYKLSIN